jgi:serine/threonine protein kinase
MKIVPVTAILSYRFMASSTHHHNLIKESDESAVPGMIPSDPHGPSVADSEKTVVRSAAPIQEIQIPPQSDVPSTPRMLPWQMAAESLLGLQLDQFRIETLVGIGGMGAVFRGKDTRLERDVAIKAVPILGRDPESMRRFQVEAQSAAKLDHPNIARVYHVGETADWSYIVFEFVEGVNLREYVLQQGPMSIDQSVYMIRQVAQALQHASERQVVHRDIKPSNIVLTPTGQAKIVDMGLARVTEVVRSSNDLTASGVTLGTFDYISPEQAHDPRDVDVRSDIYSLGCTWYFLLTGFPPFPEGTALQKLLMHGSKNPDDPRNYRPELSDSLIAILRKMIAKRPIDRYQNPLDLIDDLQTLAVVDGLAWTQSTDPRESLAAEGESYWRKLLPLLFPFACIVAIAMWMQKDATKSASFIIPDVVMTENDAASPSTIPVVPPTEPSSVVLAVPADARSIIVDDRFTLDQLATNRQLASSLEQAVERINLTPTADQIVIQSERLQCRSNLPKLNRNRNTMLIHGPPGKRCRLEIEASMGDINESRAWLDCSTTSYVFENCDLVWKESDEREVLFLCRPGSMLTLIGCTITIETDSSLSNGGALPIVVRCESSAESSNPVDDYSSARLSFRDVVVHGRADMLQASSPIRVECVWKNSVVAVNGSILSLPRVNVANRMTSVVRMNLQNVTTWTPRSWVYASWISGDAPPVQVIRTAEQCVFGGMESIVLWDVAATDEWKFWEQSKRGQELSRWLDFRGADNCYDESVTKQLLEARLRNGMMEQLPFVPEAKLLSEERGLEPAIPWRIKPNQEQVVSPYFDLRVLELVETSFPRGANLEVLRAFTAPSQPPTGNDSDARGTPIRLQ